MKKFLLGSCLLLSLLRAASAWDYTGHMLVTQIAYENVSPKVRDRVGQLVAQLDNRYNEHHPYNFITSGAWMDDMRSLPGSTWGPRHYVDVTYTPTGTPFVEPPPPNVLSTIDEALVTLKNSASSESQKVESLGWLMHCVGDAHQPLHCVDWNNDRGGNGYFIYGVTFSDVGKKSIPNLHTFWDKAFRFDAPNDHIAELYHAPWPADRPTGTGTGLIHDEAAKIMTKFPKDSLGPLLENDPHAWARESHVIACLFAYPVRPHPTDTEVVTLSPDFVHQAHEIACQRIALAGYRLAALLEQLFDKR